MPKKKINYIPSKSDALFKKVMETNTASQEFLDSYLPDEIKNILDISKVRVEKESYIEDDLKRRYSDIIYSVPYKKSFDEKAFIYCLIEHQSTSDKWMPLRLWKYMILLIERHSKGDKDLPIIVPFVVYNGKEKYNAPRCFWDLFSDSDLSKKMMGAEYKLIDLQSMSDDEIRSKPHLGLIELFMKHIHDKELLKVWYKSFKQFEELIVCDKRQGLIYIKMLLWYTYDKMPKEDSKKLNNLLLGYLEDDGEEVMQTYAEYLKEGFRAELTDEVTAKVRKELIQQVKQEVTQKVKKEVTQKVKKEVTQKVKREVTQKVTKKVTQEVEYNSKLEIAKNMLSLKKPISEIKLITGLSDSDVKSLLKPKSSK